MTEKSPYEGREDRRRKTGDRRREREGKREEVGR